MKPTLLILAAGMGSRYGGLKQLDPVGPAGETIIDYSVHDAVRAGFGKLVFVIRPDFAELFKRELGARFEKKIAVDYVYQELHKLPEGFSLPAGREKPWGTGQAILMARDAVKEPFAIINADDFYGAEGFEVMARHLEKSVDGAKAAYSMVGYLLRATMSEHGTVSRGICAIDAQGRLTGVDEVVKIEKRGEGGRDQASGREFSGEEIVSMNFFGFTPSLFAHLERLFKAFLAAKINDPKAEFYIPTVVDQLVKEGKAEVTVLKSRDSWFGVTYREDKPLVTESIRRLVASGKYPSNLRS